MRKGTWTQKEDGVIELKEDSGGGGNPLVLVVLALIIPLVAGIVFLYNAAHSPKSINIDLVNINAEFVPSKYSSSSGTRYLYFKFEVESKKQKIDEINLYLNVGDAAGNSLGRLSVSLGSSYDRLELSKGEIRSVEISWDDDDLYWGDEDIFNVLYSTDYSDLTFTYDIWRVVYSNGYIWTQSSNNNQLSNSDDNNNIIDNDTPDNDTSDNGDAIDTLLDDVQKHTGNDAILPDNYSAVVYHTPNCGWYSYADEEYHNSYYITFEVDAESTHTFVENFTNKLLGDGYTLRYDEYNYEYVKNNTVICFSNVLESRVDGRFEYYYMQYYAYSLD